MLFLANATLGSPDVYTWVDNTPAVWAELVAVLETHEPDRVAVNIDRQISFSSGLHAGEYLAVAQALGKKWASRFVSEPMVAVEYITTMPRSRLGWYRRLQETAWAMIDEAFSARVIEPGKTTTADVEWWLRSKIVAMNYTTWFHPSVSVIDGEHMFAVGASVSRDPASATLGFESEGELIRHGDMLHVDFGVTALGMNTDTQHLAYVLHPGETENDVPKSLQEGLKKGNRLQDIVKGNMKLGLTGNEILNVSLAQMHSEGIEGKIYCHPIGDWGHSAGTLIGKLPSSVPSPVSILTAST